MGVAERRAREKEALRGHILAAATELFASEGYANVSMRRIADKIEYAPSTIYLHFRDKEELISNIIQDVFDQLTEALEEANDLSLSPLEALRRGLEIYIRFGIDHPFHYKVAFGDQQPPEIPGQPSAADLAGLRCFDTLRAALARGVEAGAIRPMDLDVLSQTIWMMIHGVCDILICSRHISNFPWAPEAEVIECAVDMIIRSVRGDLDPVKK
jgi:AcrR family transcriptional regulator